MKKLIIPMLLSLSFSAFADLSLPQISAPDELVRGDFAEGTITQISPAEIAEFLPWAQNAKNQLTRALNTARTLPLRDRRTHIERSIRSVVNRSGDRQYQMFMRFSLNRGLLLVSEMTKTMDMTDIGANESALDILQRSIEVALSFYESDLSFQNRAQNGNTTTVLSYAQFATSFKNSLYAGVINVLDAKAQYRLLYKLIEMVNWDLSRDAHANNHAESIVEAYELLQDLHPEPVEDDRLNLRYIRRLNSLKLLSLGTPAVQRPVDDVGTFIGSGRRTEIQTEDLRIARSALNASSWTARLAAVRQISEIAGDDVTALLIERYLDSDGDVLAAVHSALMRRDVSDAQLQAKIMNVYGRSGSWSARNNMTKLLARARSSQATSFLIQILNNDSDGDVQASAYSALSSRSLGYEHLSDLEVLSRNASWTKRQRAAQLLGRLEHMDSFRLLGKMLARESDGDVISAINSSMTKLRTVLN
jgi:hypothetical protein